MTKKLQLSPEGVKLLDNSNLTKREVQVVFATLISSTHKETASKLGIEEKTVKFHMTEIYRKLNVKNKSELLILMYSLIEKFPEEVFEGLIAGQANKDLTK